MTSIVMLAWGRELDFVADHLHRFRCGPSPARLRPCAADDAAVRMQGPSCFRSVRQHTTMIRLLKRSRCQQSTVSLGDSAIQRAAIADAEAQRLSRLHGVESVEEHKLVSLYDGSRTSPNPTQERLWERVTEINSHEAACISPNPHPKVS